MMASFKWMTDQVRGNLWVEISLWHLTLRVCLLHLLILIFAIARNKNVYWVVKKRKKLYLAEWWWCLRGELKVTKFFWKKKFSFLDIRETLLVLNYWLGVISDMCGKKPLREIFEEKIFLRDFSNLILSLFYNVKTKAGTPIWNQVSHPWSKLSHEM